MVSGFLPSHWLSWGIGVYLQKKVSDKDIDSSKSINLVFGSLIFYISLVLIIVIPILIYKRVISLKVVLLKSESEERESDNE